MESRKPTAVLERFDGNPFRSVILSLGKAISLSESLKTLIPGKEFVIDDPGKRPNVYSAAKKLRMKVQTEKTRQGKLKVRLAQ